MTHFDVFNGDAGGICSLLQLRLATPIDSVLITGAKRDIALLQRVDAQPGDEVAALDHRLCERVRHSVMQADVPNAMSSKSQRAACRWRSRLDADQNGTTHSAVFFENRSSAELDAARQRRIRVGAYSVDNVAHMKRSSPLARFMLRHRASDAMPLCLGALAYRPCRCGNYPVPKCALNALITAVKGSQPRSDP
jgi:hypothetical protein